MTAEFDFASARAEVEAELADAISRFPAAKEAYEKAYRGYEDGQQRWNSFCTRLDRRLNRIGPDSDSNQITTISAATQRLIEHERDLYRAAGGALSQMKRDLADLRWKIECLNSDLEQLDLIQNPRKPPVVPAEPRQRPDVEDDLDNIIRPSFALGRVA